MNWITVTTNDIAKKVESDIITAATNKGFDLADGIADATAKVRGAISTGNQLDQDTTKVPRSLKALTIRIVVRALKQHMQYDLTKDERDEREEDRSYLNRIIDDKIRFESPDNSGGSSEMQSAGSLDTISGTNRSNYTREGMNGL